MIKRRNRSSGWKQYSLDLVLVLQMWQHYYTNQGQVITKNIFKFKIYNYLAGTATNPSPRPLSFEHQALDHSIPMHNVPRSCSCSGFGERSSGNVYVAPWDINPPAAKQFSPIKKRMYMYSALT